MSECRFLYLILCIHPRVVLTARLVITWLFATQNCCRLGASCVHHTTMHLSRHFMQSHIPRVHVCLAVTCHLHFWQNDRDLLRATAVTRGWNRYWNKSQLRKLTLEKKILPPLLRGSELATFQSRVLLILLRTDQRRISWLGQERKIRLIYISELLLTRLFLGK